MKFSWLAVTATPLLLAACGSDPGGAQEPLEPGDRASVVTSAYPFAFLAERVAGDLADVRNLTAPGAEPHDLELTPKQVAAVQSADLVVYVADFQPAVDEAVEQAARPEASTVELGGVVGLLETVHQDEDIHEDGDMSDDDHATDPHLWLDPQRMATAAQEVAERLSAIDPTNAAEYRANAAALSTELGTLDAEARAALATCERRTFVTAHAAFSYLADAYDLEQVAIAGLDPSQEPSPAQLGEIADLVRDEGVTTVFAEELLERSVAETVAREAGARVATLDPIEGLSDATADETYLTLMRSNVAALAAAGGCR